jgi:hypothetical protein
MTYADLQEVTPAEMVRWMNLKTFGVPERARNSDTVRPMVRANSLAFWKKGNFILYAGLLAWMAEWDE